MKSTVFSKSDLEAGENVVRHADPGSGGDNHLTGNARVGALSNRQRNSAAHRMPDQDDLVEVKLGNERFDDVGESRYRVDRWPVGAAMAGEINRVYAVIDDPSGVCGDRKPNTF